MNLGISFGQKASMRVVLWDKSLLVAAILDFADLRKTLKVTRGASSRFGFSTLELTGNH